MRPLFFRKAAIVLIAFAAWSSAKGETTTVPPAKGGAISVAVLEPEVVTDLPAADRKAIAGAIDTLLTESLSKQSNITLVDRQLLDKVLSEKTLTAGGATKATAANVAESLRPFWSAGVLICTRVDAKTKTVVIEAVSAQTGILLGAVYVRLDKLDVQEVADALEPKLGGMWDQLRQSAAVLADKPLVEVTSELAEGLERSRWLADDVADTARAHVVRTAGVTLLAARHPLVTKEERLLRLMGLAASVQGDASAALQASPDVTVRLIVTEKTTQGISFDKTPIDLTVEIVDVNSKRASKTFSGKAGQWSELTDQAMAFLDKSLTLLGDGGGSAEVNDLARARALAASQMAALKSWTDLSAWQLRDVSLHLRLRFCDIAMRAQHLDPTNETAAWMVAMTLDCDQEELPWKKRSERSCRTVAIELQRYLDRFGARNPEHHRDVLARLVRTGMLRIYALRKITTPGERRLYQGGQGLFDEPDRRKYEYARIYTRAMAQYGLLGLKNKLYANTNDFLIFGHHLTLFLIPNIPADRLDEEYAWWKSFYAKEIASLPPKIRYQRKGCDVSVPWELVDAYFAARRKDSATVRKDLQAVAGIYPKSVSTIWGGDRHKQYIVPVLLRAAGDKEWKTWRPNFAKSKEVNISLDEMTMLNAVLNPKTTDYWDYASIPSLPGMELVIPEAVRGTRNINGRHIPKSVEAVLVTDDDIWITLPGVMSGTSKVDVQLIAVRPKSVGGKLAIEDIQEIIWPEKDKLEGQPEWSFAYAMKHRGKWVVFMGTEEHGLLRLDAIDGKWVGRWITTRHGLPANGIKRMGTCLNDGRTELLVIGGHEGLVTTKNGRKQQSYICMVSALNLDTGRVTLIHDGKKDNRNVYHPAAVMKDGKKVLLELSGSGAYEHPVDIQNITKLVYCGMTQMSETAIPYTITSETSDQQARLWWPHWAGRYRTYDLTELDAHTLKSVHASGPPRGSRRGISPAVSDGVRTLLVLIPSRGYERYLGMDRWPNKGAVFAVGGRDILWMAFSARAGHVYPQYIVGYRPAPPGAKDWDDKDLWIGPFRSPGTELIIGFRRTADGSRLILSTSTHILLLDEARLLSEAQKKGMAISTHQWRRDYDARLAKSGWQSLVPAMILDKKYDEALKMIDARKAERFSETPQAQMERQTLDLWRARVLADMPGKLDDAIVAYDTIATRPDISGAAKAFARANQIVLLYRAKRYQELLDLAEEVQATFPQMKATDKRYGMGWYVARARRALAAKKRATTRPAAKPAAASVAK